MAGLGADPPDELDDLIGALSDVHPREAQQSVAVGGGLIVPPAVGVERVHRGMTRSVSNDGRVVARFAQQFHLVPGRSGHAP